MLVMLLFAMAVVTVTIEGGTLWLELGLFAVLAGTLGALAYQLWRQRQEHGFEVYQELVRWYTSHVWRAAEEPELDRVWDELPGPRRAALDAAQEGRGDGWGAWRIMTQEERRAYRWTRETLEMFEQAHLVYQRGWMHDVQWDKWRSFLRWWIGTRYFAYAFDDLRDGLLPPVCEEIDRLMAAPSRTGTHRSSG